MSIAEKLEATLGRFGVVRYGEVGRDVRPRGARGAHALALRGRHGADRADGAPARVPHARPGASGRPASRSWTPRRRTRSSVRGPASTTRADARTHRSRKERRDRSGLAREGLLRGPRRPQGRRRRHHQEGVPQARARRCTRTTTRGTPRRRRGSRTSARPTRSCPTPSSAASTTSCARWRAVPGSRRAAAAARRVRGRLRRHVRRRRSPAAVASGTPTPAGGAAGFEDLLGGLFGNGGGARFAARPAAGRRPGHQRDPAVPAGGRGLDGLAQRRGPHGQRAHPRGRPRRPEDPAARQGPPR